VRGAADIGTLATRTADGKVAVLLWHYHDDDLPGPDAAIRLSVAGLKRGGGKAGRATLWRIDGEHANAFAEWKRLGSVQSPDQDLYARLEAASRLQPETLTGTRGAKGTTVLDVRLARQGVALVMLDK